MITKKVINVGDAPHIRLVSIGGDLSLQGWGQTEVQIEVDDGDGLVVDASNAPLTIETQDDTVIRVPFNAQIEILQVEGDLQIGSVHGQLLLGQINGDASVRETGALTVTVVHGDLSAQQINGAVRLRRVEGDATLSIINGSVIAEGIGDDVSLREVNGDVHVTCGDEAALHNVRGHVHAESGSDLSINNVTGNVTANAGSECSLENVTGEASVNAGGDLSVQNVAGGVVATSGGDMSINSVTGNLLANTGGDAALRFAPMAGKEYRVEAGGSISCRLPFDASCKVRMVAGGGVNVRKFEAVPIQMGNIAEVTLGEGGSQLQQTAGGDITLSGQSLDRPFDFNIDIDFGGKTGPEIAAAAGEFTRNILGQVESGIRSLSRSLDERLARMGNSDEIAGRVQEKVQHAIRRAEEKIAEAMREAEKRGHEAEKRMADMEARQQRRGVYWGPPPPPPPAPKPPKPPKAPEKSGASEEERLLVLRMVSEGKISVEQAEQLLAALQGK